jgi:hypothetical protein
MGKRNGVRESRVGEGYKKGFMKFTVDLCEINEGRKKEKSSLTNLKIEISCE